MIERIATRAEQTRDCLSQGGAWLEWARSSGDKMLKTVIWRDDMANLAEMKRLGVRGFPKATPPPVNAGKESMPVPS